MRSFSWRLLGLAVLATCEGPASDERLDRLDAELASLMAEIRETAAHVARIHAPRPPAPTPSAPGQARDSARRLDESGETAALLLIGSSFVFNKPLVVNGTVTATSCSCSGLADASPSSTPATVDGVLCGSDAAVWNPRVEEGYAGSANLWIPNTVPDRNTSLQIDGIIGAEHFGHAITTAVVGAGSTLSAGRLHLQASATGWARLSIEEGGELLLYDTSAAAADTFCDGVALGTGLVASPTPAPTTPAPTTPAPTAPPYLTLTTCIQDNAASTDGASVTVDGVVVGSFTGLSEGDVTTLALPHGTTSFTLDQLGTDGWYVCGASVDGSAVSESDGGAAISYFALDNPCDGTYSVACHASLTLYVLTEPPPLLLRTFTCTQWSAATSDGFEVRVGGTLVGESVVNGFAMSEGDVTTVELPHDATAFTLDHLGSDGWYCCGIGVMEWDESAGDWNVYAVSETDGGAAINYFNMDNPVSGTYTAPSYDSIDLYVLSTPPTRVLQFITCEEDDEPNADTSSDFDIVVDGVVVETYTDTIDFEDVVTFELAAGTTSFTVDFGGTNGWVVCDATIDGQPLTETAGGSDELSYFWLDDPCDSGSGSPCYASLTLYAWDA